MDTAAHAPAAPLSQTQHHPSPESDAEAQNTAMAGLSASDQHFLRKCMAPPPGGAAAGPGGKPLRLRFSRTPNSEAVSKFVDGECARRSEQQRSKPFKMLDMCTKWKVVQEYAVATKQDGVKLRAALLEDRLIVSYDPAARRITGLEMRE